MQRYKDYFPFSLISELLLFLFWGISRLLPYFFCWKEEDNVLKIEMGK